MWKKKVKPYHQSLILYGKNKADPEFMDYEVINKNKIKNLSQ